MKKIYSIILAFTGLLLSNSAHAQTLVQDYLSAPDPILVDSISYALSQSSHPSDHYYQQEYLQKGEHLEKFKRMILIEFVGGNRSVKNVVDSKVSEIRQRPVSSVIYYSILNDKKSGEYMLDFATRTNSPDGQSVTMVERNLFHFKAVQDATGRKGVLLFGVSSRAYSDDIDKFLAVLKTNKNDMIRTILRYGFPSIKIPE